MPLIAISRLMGTQDSGNLYYQSTDGGPFTLQDLTDALVGTRNRPVVLKYKNRVYILGIFSAPMVVNEYRQNYPMGINAPEGSPTLASGAGTGGSNGLMIGYITFVHKENGKTMQESNPSSPSDTIENLGGQGRLWTNLPTTALDSRVTHIRGYVSVDGALPARAWERQLGVQQVFENTLTSSLGERLPVIVGIDSEVDLNPFARCKPPNARIGEFYHDALWLAGDDDFPTRIYYSRLFEPESFNTIDKDNGWLETPDGERVTGLKRHGDMLIVGCLRAIYAIQGFSSGDYQIVKINNYYGVISHHSMQLIGPDSDLWAAGQEGVWAFDGSFRDMMEDDFRNYWRDDYRANPVNYEDSFAAEDRFERTYQLIIPQDDGTTFKYVGSWIPVKKDGSPPWWTWDIRNRQDSAIGSLIPGDDDHFGELLTGSCDGFIRKENVQDDGDDDGDTYQKALDIWTKHFFFGDQSGDHAHGRDYTDFDVFLRHPVTAITMSAYAGDDAANEAASPQWSQTLAATAVSTPFSRVPKTSDHIGPVAEINGKGITLRFHATSPTQVGLRGFSIYHTTGEQERPRS